MEESHAIEISTPSPNSPNAMLPIMLNPTWVVFIVKQCNEFKGWWQMMKVNHSCTGITANLTMPADYGEMPRCKFEPGSGE